MIFDSKRHTEMKKLYITKKKNAAAGGAQAPPAAADQTNRYFTIFLQ